ncbi:MAG: DUF2341 domain-containing protein, partial [Candidatus Aenigmarchaeota archaeon]|nr:DUF2341 domain-containing protein [Candidatus Aenigmarchaeota archaeon]
IPFCIFTALLISIPTAFAYDTWLNTSWHARIPLNFTNAEARNITDRQVNFTANSTPGMQADFDDLRFTWLNLTSRAEREIPHFIARKTDSVSAVVRLKIPFIEASGNATVFMYFWNPKAAGNSNLTGILTIPPLQEWTNSVSDLSAGNDEFDGVDLDSSNDVFAAGVGSGGTNPFAGLFKFNGTNGTQIWNSTFNEGCTTGAENAYLDVAVDSGNNAIAAGRILEKGQACNSRRSDFFLAKFYGNNGTQAWNVTINQSTNINGASIIFDGDQANGVAVDSQGNAIAVGTDAQAGSSGKVLVRKFYGSNGTQTWNVTAATSQSGRRAAVDSADNIFVTSTEGGIFKLYGTNGTTIWSTSTSGLTAHEVAVDSNGDVAIVGTSSSNYLVKKYNGSTGSEIWSATLNFLLSGGTEEANGLAVDSLDNVVVMGDYVDNDISGNSNITFAKLNGTSGAQIWNMSADESVNPRDGRAVAIDTADAIMLAGRGVVGGEAAIYKYKDFNLTSQPPSSFFAPQSALINWTRTFDSANQPRSYFGKGERVRIKSNTTGDPNITISFPNGTVAQAATPMTQAAGGLLEFNFTTQASYPIGFYTLTVNNTGQAKSSSSFYTGDVWSDSFNGTTLRHRVRINISEPNRLDRWYDPVDISMAFNKSAFNNSIRVAFFNGSHYIEIPSQVHSKTESGNLTSQANVTFLASIGRNQSNQSYYIAWATSSIGSPNYSTDLSLLQSSPLIFIQNAAYNLTFNSSGGGLLQDSRNKLGTNSSLAGTTPMEFKPDATIVIPPATTFSVRKYPSPSITIESGPVFVRYAVNGYLSSNTNYPYNLTMKFYSQAPFYTEAKNITTIDASRTWRSFFPEQVVWRDGAFSHFRFRNSTGQINGTPVASGDGQDSTGLDANLTWIGVYDNYTFDSMGDVLISRSQPVEKNPKANFKDESSSDYYERGIIDGQTDNDIPSGSSFTTSLARAFWDGSQEYHPIQDISDQLNSPLNMT